MGVTVGTLDFPLFGENVKLTRRRKTVTISSWILFRHMIDSLKRKDGRRVCFIGFCYTRARSPGQCTSLQLKHHSTHTHENHYIWWVARIQTWPSLSLVGVTLTVYCNLQVTTNVVAFCRSRSRLWSQVENRGRVVSNSVTRTVPLPVHTCPTAHARWRRGPALIREWSGSD